MVAEPPCSKAMESHGPGAAAGRDRSPRGRSRDLSARASRLSSSLSSRSASAPRVRARSVPAVNSPTAHRPGVDLRPLASAGQVPTAQAAQQTQYFNVGTPPQQFTPPTLPTQLPVPPGSSGTLDQNTVNLFRQMMQAQDEQIRASQAPGPAAHQPCEGPCGAWCPERWTGSREWSHDSASKFFG